MIVPMSVLPAFLIASVLSVGVHFLCVKLFPTLRLLDFPERYGLTRPRLPYPIGIATAALMCVAVFGYGQELTVNRWILIAAILILLITCAVDDLRGIPAPLRLVIQTLLALGLFFAGTRIYTLQNPLSATGMIPLDQLKIDLGTLQSIPVWSCIVTVGWLLLTMNAMNWFDGVTGQVSVLSVVSFVTLGVLALLPGIEQRGVAVLSLMLAGVCIGSAVFTFPPPRAILGDSGAMVIGLLIGVLAMSAGGKVATAFLVLGVPLTDSVIVIVRRIVKGESPLRGNARDEHLHHRLLLKGWSERKVILLSAILAIGFGASALFLKTQGKLIAAAILVLIMLGLSYYSRPLSDR